MREGLEESVEHRLHLNIRRNFFPKHFVIPPRLIPTKLTSIIQTWISLGIGAGVAAGASEMDLSQANTAYCGAVLVTLVFYQLGDRKATVNFPKDC